MCIVSYPKREKTIIVKLRYVARFAEFFVMGVGVVAAENNMENTFVTFCVVFWWHNIAPVGETLFYCECGDMAGKVGI
jgi:hypothetical protein